MLAGVRRFFRDRDVLQVDTPILTKFAVSDPSIDCVSVGKEGLTGFLRSSPEYFMKRMLAAGFPDIFEIGRVFRNGEVGREHEPEFTLIEWYRRGFGLTEIIDETTSLIRSIIGEDLRQAPPRILDYTAAFAETLGIDPLCASIDTLADAADADERLRRSIGDHREAWLDLLLAARIAPGFSSNELTVLQHYPAAQAALARLCPSDSRLADRFEVFLGRLELANGYVELTDASEQRDRFLIDQSRRREQGLPVRELDEDFLRAMTSGLPQCAGVAVGFERLLMIDENVDDIQSVCPFPWRAGNHVD